MATHCQKVFKRGFDMGTELCGQKLPCSIHGIKYSQTPNETLTQTIIDNPEEIPSWLLEGLQLLVKIYR